MEYAQYEFINERSRRSLKKLGREIKKELKVTLHGDLVFKPSEDMPLSFRDQGELRVSDKTEGLMRELIIKDQDVTYLENGKPTAISKAKAWVIEIGQDRHD